MNEVEQASAVLDAAHRQSYEEQDDKILVRTFQDVEPHLEYAAKCRRADADIRGTFGKRAELRRTMTVPFNVMMGVAERLGIPQGKIFEKEYSQRIMRELKTPEFKLFRTCTDKRI